MKITIVGYGKMGKEIEWQARSAGLEVVSIIHPSAKGAGHYTEINAESLANAEVVIDFSSSAAALGNIEKTARLGKNIVVGTTGWQENLADAKKIIERYGTGLLHSPNFSLGVNLFLKTIGYCAEPFANAGYDVFAYELHHSRKSDNPSGTAKAIAGILRETTQKKPVFGESPGVGEFQVCGIRCGSIPGTHVVGFDSPNDTIEITHTARSRDGFVQGALEAAQWINGRKGFFGMDDFMKYHLARKG